MKELGAVRRLKEIARIKGDDEYEWFKYTGSEFELSRKGKPHSLTKGDKFGVRRSSNGKQIRLVLESLGPTFVFTLSPEDAQAIAKKAKAA
jgi:predicted unusual protein kinase regulating ubiquinone biosynthesis (AarF/ABC1/UbiB family)